MTEAFKIIKLKGRENYDTWAVGAKSYLVTKELWDFIKDPDVGAPPPTNPPTDPPTDPPANSSTSALATAYQSVSTLLAKSHARARAEIILMVEPELYSYVSGETAYDAWNSLKNAFADKGATRKVTLLNNADNNMEKYVQVMLLNWSKVKASGFEIDEEVIASVILGGLPNEYRPMILGIENSGAQLTVDYVKNVLLHGILEEKSNNEKAMAAKCSFGMKKGAGKKSASRVHLSFECKQNKRKTDKRKCFNCGKSNHFAKDCRQPKKKQNNGEQSKKEQSNGDQEWNSV